MTVAPPPRAAAAARRRPRLYYGWIVVGVAFVTMGVAVTARTGFKLAGSHATLDGWSVVPSLRADYVRRMRGGNDGMTVRFAMADSVAIALPLAHGDTDWAEIKGGVTMSRSNLSFGAGFETAVAREGAKDDRAMVEVGLRF